MFLPMRFPDMAIARIIPRAGVKRVAAIFGLYLVVSASAVGSAYLLKVWSVNQIYARFTDDAVLISITRVTEDSLSSIVDNVLRNEEVKRLMMSNSTDVSTKYVSYVLPAGYYALEIPMVHEDVVDRLHFLGASHDRRTCRLIITEAAGADRQAKGKEILLSAVRKVPILEAWVDLRSGEVTRVESLANQAGISRMPGPMF